MQCSTVLGTAMIFGFYKGKNWDRDGHAHIDFNIYPFVIKCCDGEIAVQWMWMWHQNL